MYDVTGRCIRDTPEAVLVESASAVQVAMAGVVPDGPEERQGPDELEQPAQDEPEEPKPAVKGKK